MLIIIINRYVHNTFTNIRISVDQYPTAPPSESGDKKCQQYISALERSYRYMTRNDMLKRDILSADKRIEQLKTENQLLSQPNMKKSLIVFDEEEAIVENQSTVDITCPADDIMGSASASSSKYSSVTRNDSLSMEKEISVLLDSGELNSTSKEKLMSMVQSKIPLESGFSPKSNINSSEGNAVSIFVQNDLFSGNLRFKEVRFLNKTFHPLFKSYNF